MKPWLLNILACPICKHHPLDPFIFRWEEYTPDPPKPEDRGFLVKELQDGTISPSAFDQVEDTSDRGDLHDLLAETKKALGALTRQSGSLSVDDDASKKLLDQVFQYFHHEIEQGVLRCPSCERWFPVGNQVKGIPELLPDDLRDKARDVAFLDSVKAALPVTVTRQGKPFSLGNNKEGKGRA